jgi:drug/metabolite transporter (DMT)-like permease
MQVDRAGTALSSFIVGTALAGGNAVGVRVSNRELDPLWGAGLRFLLAACLLGAVMAVMRLTLPRGRALLGVLLYGSLIFGGAFSFAYYALVRIHAGLGQTLLGPSSRSRRCCLQLCSARSACDSRPSSEPFSVSRASA